MTWFRESFGVSTPLFSVIMVGLIALEETVSLLAWCPSCSLFLMQSSLFPLVPRIYLTNLTYLYLLVIISVSGESLRAGPVLLPNLLWYQLMLSSFLLARLLYKSNDGIGHELFSFGKHLLPPSANLKHTVVNPTWISYRQAVTSLLFKTAGRVHSSSRQEGVERLLLASWSETCGNLGSI